MKVEFCGSGDSGKTTTAKLVAKELGFKLLESPAKAILEANNITDKKFHELPSKRQYEVQMEIFRARLSLVQDHKDINYVADRTLLCSLVYSLMKGWDQLDDNDLQYLLTATGASLGVVDLLVYFPLPHWKLEDNPFKLQTRASRVTHDALIVGLLHKFGIQFLDVFAGTPEERAMHIVTVAKLAMSAKARVKAAEPSPLVLG